SFPEDATEKAKDLVRMAVARAGTLEPLKDMAFEVNQKGLVIGGGLSGMTAALSLAEQGFETYLVEKEAELGGNLRRIKSTLSGERVEDRLKALIEQVEREEKITIYKQAEVIGFSGHVGKYKTTITLNGKNIDLEHGAVIIATGGVEYQPQEYLYGQDSGVVTQKEFEEKLYKGDITRGLVKEVVMIQCVGSREEGAMFCSRVCCSGAIKNALILKEIDPQINVTILFRDIRTYAFSELFYRKAREKGIMFVRFDLDRRPVAEKADGRIRVKAFDEVIGREIEFDPDYLVLSAGIRPNPLSEELSTRLKVPLTVDGFYLEAHMKLRPLDFSNEGMYLCGLAHSPKLIGESIAQARGAAARAATILSKKELLIGGMISVVDKERCAACLTCVRECPFDVPVITEEGVAWIEPASCQGCGICASACPRKAIDLQNYKDSQVISKCEVLFDTIDAALGA
ncbi:MAG TPA: FAD-dependent oxidoreductase, partial [Thermodesulfobacteriota bacterium]|nr:FAD-dependent oxidoreductase [Thermodesulfobacteriota bacterium]